jgi:sulfatase modifying factor 1
MLALPLPIALSATTSRGTPQPTGTGCQPRRSGSAPAGLEGPVRDTAPLDAIAWYRDNSDGRPHEVGGKQPNARGLHDTLGNVWEWCWDLYDPEVYGTYRLLRGGGWFDEHWSCRTSVRRRSHPAYRIDDVGFRIARG